MPVKREPSVLFVLEVNIVDDFSKVIPLIVKILHANKDFAVELSAPNAFYEAFGKLVANISLADVKDYKVFRLAVGFSRDELENVPDCKYIMYITQEFTFENTDFVQEHIDNLVAGKENPNKFYDFKTSVGK